MSLGDEGESLFEVEGGVERFRVFSRGGIHLFLWRRGPAAAAAGVVIVGDKARA